MTAEGVSGKVVVVTGAAGQLGSAAVALLTDRGAQVVASDQVRSAALPAGAKFFRFDVTERGAWDDLADQIERIYGHVDGLVNCAAISHGARLGEVQIRDWDRVIAVNIAGPMFGMQALAGLMPPGSVILNVGSSAAFMGHPDVAYSATMWALRGLTRAASLELGPLGIRVNAIHPGYVGAQTTASAPDGLSDVGRDLTTVGRLGRAEEFASVVAFLLSDDASYIANTDIAVDGGATGHAGSKLARAGATSLAEDKMYYAAHPTS